MATKTDTWKDWMLRAVLGIAVFFLIDTHATVKEMRAFQFDMNARTFTLETRLGNLEYRVQVNERWREERTLAIEEFYRKYEIKLRQHE